MVKYYVYISKTKVEMLFGQLPPAFLSGTEAEIKVNLGIFSSVLKGRAPERPKALVQKTELVADFLKRHVGTPADDKPWIAASLPVQYGIVNSEMRHFGSAAMFVGSVGDLTVLLVGSAQSMIGHSSSVKVPPQRVPDGTSLHYYELYTLKFVSEHGLVKADPRGENLFKKSSEEARKLLPAKLTAVEFIARVLHRQPDLVVASPVYVALNDERE
jgi:hypothetical protein